jgi:hypothetical protein
MAEKSIIIKECFFPFKETLIGVDMKIFQREVFILFQGRALAEISVYASGNFDIRINYESPQF